jgi:hypothetical protein
MFLFYPNVITGCELDFDIHSINSSLKRDIGEIK